jgi:N-acetyl-anhydromuramyl-L-alanine amidase AmpD
MAEFLMDPQPIHATDFLEKIGLSAHALIDSRGTIFICRDDDEGAYHAKGYNQNSLGLEFLVPGHHNYGSFLEEIKSDNWVSQEMWETGVNCVRRWCHTYDIPRGKVFRHSDLSPGRKVDPGSGFKWNKFLNEVFRG